jgi:hypothetical protein
VTTPLADAEVTATMTLWMTVGALGHDRLFGFADWHPKTGGLSWVLSTPVVAFTQAADRARTRSGRVYALGRHISSRELDEEGRVALRLLLTGDPTLYPSGSGDLRWLTAQKMARHLRVTAPPRSDPIAVERFLDGHLEAYIQRRRDRLSH